MKILLKGIGDHCGTSDQLNFDPKNCSLRITASIGIKDEPGADYFTVQVITLSFLSSCDKPVWGKGLLIVKAFTWLEVERAILELVSGIAADTWDDYVKILTRYMGWEYEGMKGSDGEILVPYAGESCGNRCE